MIIWFSPGRADFFNVSYDDILENVIQRYNLEPAKADEILELKNNLETLKAYDDISTIIPKRIVIRGFLDDKRVFAHSISNWR